MKPPLVIVTHGAAQPSTAPFQRPVTIPTLAKTAEERGYIVAAVTGYHARAKGIDAIWLPVVGGAHTDAWAQPEVIKQIFDFFDTHKKKG